MIPMMMNPNDMFIRFGSSLATIMFLRALYEQYVPFQWREAIKSYLGRYTERIVLFFSPYKHIKFEEYAGERFNKNEVYKTIKTYLSEKTGEKTRRFTASYVKDGKEVVLGLANNEEVTDEFNGVTVWWTLRKHVPKGQTISWYPGSDQRRYYKLKYHGRDRECITESYLKHVIDEGKAIAIRRRQRKLYTNIKEDSGGRRFYPSSLWSHVEFKHPATFNTLALDASKKDTIMTDLRRFSEAKDYYCKIGKPWKRGYLLYGPPGTGKSTMIAAMANFLEYDIYDLELTSVKDNTQLRQLLIDTSSKSIVVIEDIDCSLDLTGQRSKKNEKEKEKEKKDKGTDDKKDKVKKKLKKVAENSTKTSEVTLSGLLNFIDGIWSACGDERIIVFTTNYIEKLDPALIRRGRMDMHIELSYCGYDAFKALAWNYFDVESHPLFDAIKRLLEEAKMTPADVAENLMPKSLVLDADASLENLVCALEKAKEDARLKAEEEEREKEKAKNKAEEEEKKLKDKEANTKCEEAKIIDGIEKKPSSKEENN